MTLLENLLILQRKLNRPSRWTQGWVARNADGTPVWSYDRTACCWCLIGAANAVTVTFGENRQLLGALQARALTKPDENGDVFEMPLDEWNDDPDRTFREVRDLIARAIDAETARLQAEKEATMNDPLSPCLICEGEMTIECMFDPHSPLSKARYYVYCRKCKHSPWHFLPAKWPVTLPLSRKEAITRWNGECEKVKQIRATAARARDETTGVDSLDFLD